MLKNKRQKKLEAADYGRKDGWEVKLNSMRIAELMHPNLEDMFWYSYELSVINSLYKEALSEITFWERNDLQFLSKALNEYCQFNPIVNFLREDSIKKVLVRGLYIYV